MRQSTSSNSDSNHDDSPHSPLHFVSPLHSPYSSPLVSPESIESRSKSIVAADKYTPPPALTEEKAEAHTAVRDEGKVETVLNSAVREKRTTVGGGRSGGDEQEAVGKTEVLRRPRSGKRIRVSELGFRVCEVVLCMISFSVMAADKTQGWSGDSFYRYKELRYCLAVNAIAFAYSGFQACDLGSYVVSGKHMIHHHFQPLFNFLMDQIIAYLLISSSSSAATRIDDWQSNWGKDEFTEMATVSIAMSFLAFIAFAISSLMSGYFLCNHDLA